MKQVQVAPSANMAAVNPVQDPQILPISYALPICTTRFSWPAASACAPTSLLDLFFRKK